MGYMPFKRELCWIFFPWMIEPGSFPNFNQRALPLVQLFYLSFLLLHLSVTAPRLVQAWHCCITSLPLYPVPNWLWLSLESLPFCYTIKWWRHYFFSLVSSGVMNCQFSPIGLKSLVSHLDPFSFLSAASSLCRCSKKDLAPVALSMSLTFRL